MPSGLPMSLPAALQRQVLRTASKRRFIPAIPARSFGNSAPAAAPKRPLLTPESGHAHTAPALSALLSRLSLANSPDAQATLQACLTHPSFVAAEASSSSSAALEDLDSTGESNELLAALGNSLLGLYTSEHLASLYPYLPTEALGSAVTAYVGNAACLSVARELGVAVTPALTRAEYLKEQEGEKKRKAVAPNLNRDAGVPIRWKRQMMDVEPLPVARRFRRFVKASQEAEGGDAIQGGQERKEGWEHVVASTVKAFVGMIYQEQGMHAARQFVHAHFLSRYLDMTTLFNFKNPKHVLSRAIAKHLAERGVSDNEGQGKIESRLLAETGRHTQSPIFSIGLFLPSGLKLAEGHGSSLAMAEHRAAVNALHSLYLVRSDSGRTDTGAATSAQLPTEAHGQWALEAGRVGRGGVLRGQGIGGGSEVLAESGRR